MMCPIWPLHIILLYLFPLLVTYTAAKQWRSIEISTASKLQLHMGSMTTINFTLHNVTRAELEPGSLRLEVSDPSVLTASLSEEIAETNNALEAMPLNDGISEFKSQFDIRAQFLGYSDIRIKLKVKDEGAGSEGTPEATVESAPLRVAVTRQERPIDRVFTISVAALVSIIFVNFGCALDWPLLKSSLRVPVAPTIGFVSQFLFMPVISFFLGRLLFPDSVPLQLGLFFTGVAPGGGASNVWIYALGGNINLSITMTAVSTFAAFVMIPLWSFSLGRVIFSDGNMVIPYRRITGFAVALVIPLAVGYVIQRRLPRLSQLMVRILKPFSGTLIVFIVLFAIYTNMYLFQLFTWKIVLAGAGLPWFGYLFGYLLARMLKQPPPDVLAIAIETGIQNTGISIFMLRFALGQPEADMTTVVPVAVALMTPLPLLLYSIYYKYQSRVGPSELKKTPMDIPSSPAEITKLPLDNDLGGGGAPLVSTICETLTPKNGTIWTPKTGYSTPKTGYSTPKNGTIWTPKNGESTPKNGYLTQKNGYSTPKNGYLCQKHGTNNLMFQNGMTHGIVKNGDALAVSGVYTFPEV